MRLQARFIQLPLVFDTSRLASEIHSIPEQAWRPHPMGFAGNDFLPLVAVNGDPQNETFSGPMRPTPHLTRERPYLWQTIASLGATVGRTRLMRLSGESEVSEHSDVNYYWRERMRVHVPILTQPEVRFHCDGLETHMAPGESWIFDTWLQHRVVNHHSKPRIHLVMDTVGGDRLQTLIENGRNLERPQVPGWAPRLVASGGDPGQVEFETFNVPVVMSPWEVREHLSFLLSEVAPNQPRAAVVARAAARFANAWRGLWAAYGDDEAGWDRYSGALEHFTIELQSTGASDVMLRNDVDFMESARSIVLEFALSVAVRQRLQHKALAGAS